MTAGLHHRWRARAVDLAQVGPGDRVLDVATGTGDLAIELRRAGRARRRGDRQRLLGADARARAQGRAKAPGSCASSGPTRWRCPIPTMTSPRRRSASGRATSRTCDAGLREMTRVVRARGARRGARDHHAAAATPLALLPAVVRPRSCPLLGRVAATPTPTATCRTRSGAFPARGARRGDGRRGSRRHPLHAHRRRDHRHPRRHRARAPDGRDVLAARGDGPSRARCRRSSIAAATRCARAWSRSSGACARSSASHGPARRRTPARSSPPAASGCARCWSSSPRRRRRRRRGSRTREQALIRAAVAVELVHSATLVHDDVLDAAPLRRGRPTVVAAGGAAWPGGRRPAVRARLRRARAQRERGAAARAVRARAPRSRSASCASARTPTASTSSCERYCCAAS